jgi:3-oxosteroid 1-dehydrogenase
MRFDESFDVVVLGSGAAGTSAAIAAARSGLDVLLLEKADVLGGCTTYSGGVIWLGIDPYSNELDSDELEDAVAYLTFVTAGTLPRDDLVRFVMRSRWAFQFLRSQGIRVERSEGYPEIYYPIAPGSKVGRRAYQAGLFRTADLGPLAGSLGRSPYYPTGASMDELVKWGSRSDETKWDQALMESRRINGDYRGFGMGLAGNLLLACQKADVTIRSSCGGRELLVEGGSVVGVRAGSTSGDKDVRIEARRGVVIATGGVEGNHDFVRKFEDLPAWHTHFPPDVTGDGTLMALHLGASLLRSPHNLRVMLGYKLPTPEAGRYFRSAGILECAARHSMIVNFGGQRFADESSFQYMVNEIKRFDVATHSFVNYPCYLIMDSQFFAKTSFAGRSKGSAPPDWLPSGTTPDELAGKLGIDKSGFAATLAEFNQAVATGEDKRFGRGTKAFSKLLGGSVKTGETNNLGTIERGPFYGVPLIPTGQSSVTLQIDSNGAVLDNFGVRIAGLHACGNAARDVDAGPGYQAGMSHAQAITMGCTIGTLLAGKELE